jgi:hypothetical protein
LVYLFSHPKCMKRFLQTYAKMKHFTFSEGNSNLKKGI